MQEFEVGKRISAAGTKLALASTICALLTSCVVTDNAGLPRDFQLSNDPSSRKAVIFFSTQDRRTVDSVPASIISDHTVLPLTSYNFRLRKSTNGKFVPSGKSYDFAREKCSAPKDGVICDLSVRQFHIAEVDAGEYSLQSAVFDEGVGSFLLKLQRVTHYEFEAGTSLTGRLLKSSYVRSLGGAFLRELYYFGRPGGRIGVKSPVFQAESGRVLYLGNLIFNSDRRQDFSIEIEDKFEADRRFFGANYNPTLSSKLEKRIWTRQE